MPPCRLRTCMRPAIAPRGSHPAWRAPHSPHSPRPTRQGLGLADHARLVCALLDVPLQEGCSGRALLEAVHHLLLLLLEFRGNPFFQHAGAAGGIYGGGGGSGGSSGGCGR